MSTSEAINLLKTQSLTRLVYEDLEQKLATGQLLPGQPLREAAIASDMGISRGPIREAFRMLEERGLVAVEKNYGVRVRQLDLTQATQVYEVRISLEALIGELAATNMEEAAHQQVRQILEAMEEKVAAKDVAAYTELNFRFHDLLAKASGNPVLHDTYRRLVVQLKLFRAYTFRHNPETIVTSLAEHRAIHEAMADSDASLAAGRLRQHAMDSLTRLRMATKSRD